MSEIACTAIIRGRCITVKRWEIQQFNTIQDHDGASMWYKRTANTAPNDLQIPLVNSWLCHPYSDRSSPAHCMEDEEITSGQRNRAMIKPSVFLINSRARHIYHLGWKEIWLCLRKVRNDEETQEINNIWVSRKWLHKSLSQHRRCLMNKWLQLLQCMQNIS